MELETVRSYVLARRGAVEDFPFGPTTLVAKVGGKMFALLGINATPLSISLKCEPQRALFWRDMFSAVQPGYHLNKEHWNTVTLDDTIPNDELWTMIDHSYALVVKGLPRALRSQFAE